MTLRKISGYLMSMLRTSEQPGKEWDLLQTKETCGQQDDMDKV